MLILAKPIPSDFRKGTTYPAGTRLCFVEWLSLDRVVAEVRNPEKDLVGGWHFDVIMLGPGDATGLAQLCDACFQDIYPVEEKPVGVLSPERWTCDGCLSTWSLEALHPHHVEVEHLFKKRRRRSR